MKDLQEYNIKLFWPVLPIWLAVLVYSILEGGWAWYIAGTILTYLSGINFRLLVVEGEPEQKEV